jgi:hypothetical protein
MTKIFFERSGGFMGRKVTAMIDFEELPVFQAEALEEMLDEADFFELPADLTKPPMPDAFTYTITVTTEMRRHSVRVSDATAPDDLRPLLEELNKRARMQR